MLLGGLWHGASWNFVIWGGIHGAWLSVERFLTRGKATLRWYNRVLALAVVALSWIFFRAKTVAAAFHMIAALTRFEWRPEYAAEIFFLAVVSGAMMLVDYRLEAYREEYVFERGSLAVPIGAALAMVALMVFFAASETNAFIYFQF